MRRALALLVAALAAGGCMGGDEASFEANQLERMVLQPRDLPSPAGWVRFDHGRQVRADQPAGERADPARFGRIEGWKARYRREAATPATRGPLVVETRADVFEDDGGAEDELEAHRAELSGEWRTLDAPELGDETFATTLTQGNVRFYVVAWRVENATVSVNANGFDGKLTLSQTVELARKQQRRLERASE
jgi:hypothetical protein